VGVLDWRIASRQVLPPNKSLQPTAIPLRGLPAAELTRFVEAGVPKSCRSRPAETGRHPSVSTWHRDQ
jgi:hypothetical protein